MQTQFNSSNAIPTSATVPLGLGAPLSPPPAGVEKDLVLLDWNTCRPDGTEASLQKAIARIALVFRGNVSVGLRAASGTVELFGSQPMEDPAKEPLCRSATTEAMHSSQSCLFATASGQTSLVLQQLRTTNDAALVIGFGAQIKPGPDLQAAAEPDQGEFGVVVSIAGASEIQTKEEYASLIASTQQQFQHWLQIWRLCQVGASVSKWKKRLDYYRTRKGKIALLCGLALLCSLAIPVPYWPQRACIVEPAAKSFVASPIDGRIRAATVRPGDSVKQGQLLARLDDEQLQRSLASAEAEFEAAGKRRDAALATRAAGDMRLAQLEQERIELEIESLQSQLSRLELRSPTDGIVVQGDWFQSDGAPVERGDMLFEIAPMDKMRVEIHLSTDDLARIKVDDLATIRVDAAPGEKWSARLDRIDPRGQVIDTEVVFAANIEVPNESSQLRPGMKGTTRISAGTQTIGWLLFHQPAMWLMKKLAW